ncbi:MAG: hypothetical protein M3Z14_03210 [Candidatus Eremiobacteraeota bacterium]|nr:hypothetical protein [Candidatus Eremiobacteraeota bacterium]
MERRDLYQDDLTEENMPSPAQREDQQQDQELDPDVDSGEADARTGDRSTKKGTA